MKKYFLILFSLLAGLLIFTARPAFATEIKVAVASNFSAVMILLVEKFEAESSHRIKLISGSTGKHYAQIINGAPFDLFLAADSKRPELLEVNGMAVAGSRFTYAIGQLVLWSPRADFVDATGEVLQRKPFNHLAIANPLLAPYGQAAKQVLQSMNNWTALVAKIVRGENIAQTFQFVSSGNAELGFIALSQIQRPGHPITGSWWKIPASLYSPINQQAVVLKDNDGSRAFVNFIKSQAALEIIHSFGYLTP